MIYEAMNQAFYGFDTAVYTFVGNHQTVFLNHLNWFFTFFGGDPVAYFLMALGLVLCFPKKSRKYGMTLLIAVFLSFFVTNYGIKGIFNRPRPFITLKTAPFWPFYEAHHRFAVVGTGHQPSYEPSMSFPSGHTTLAFTYTTALICSCMWSGRKWAWWLTPWPFLVGLSRIYIFVHYPSDVLFGMLNGILWGILGYLTARFIYEQMEKKHKLEAVKLSE